MEKHYTRRVNQYVGKRLREARLMRGITQDGLAGEVGLTYQQIQKYETGKTNINAGRLFHLARVLGVPPEYFFAGLDNPTQDIGTPLENRKEWLKLAAAAAGIQNTKFRSALKTIILAAQRMERETHTIKRKKC